MNIESAYHTADGQEPAKVCCLQAKTALRLHAAVSMVYLIGAITGVFYITSNKLYLPVGILVAIQAYNVLVSILWLK